MARRQQNRRRKGFHPKTAHQRVARARNEYGSHYGLPSGHREDGDLNRSCDAICAAVKHTQSLDQHARRSHHGEIHADLSKSVIPDPILDRRLIREKLYRHRGRRRRRRRRRRAHAQVVWAHVAVVWAVDEITIMRVCHILASRVGHSAPAVTKLVFQPRFHTMPVIAVGRGVSWNIVSRGGFINWGGFFVFRLKALAVFIWIDITIVVAVEILAGILSCIITIWVVRSTAAVTGISIIVIDCIAHP
mmetsp:Transcript_42453/g.92501  ORF Transcript_42453/g.92501 Transcript_42453/m.92501 type:complete len:247 (+) Transcript_42453:292-1032(+)